MPEYPSAWATRSPGDLKDILPEVMTGDVDATVARSVKAAGAWAELPLERRKAALRECQSAIRANRDLHARNIARETGKPLREAKEELDAVIAKFEPVFEDADIWISDRAAPGGLYDASVRFHPYGVAAVIAPFNFPLHLGHGATVAFLLAGNTVIFKPSPMAAVTAEAYADDMRKALPEDVFQLVQGWGETGSRLCMHQDVRAICFTGSVSTGIALSRALADDPGKLLALELGGKNAIIVCEDADIAKAAAAAADGFCLTSGQRCNASTRLLVHQNRLDDFVSALKAEVARYRPGWPLDPKTTLGPLINEQAVARYQRATALPAGEWILPGRVCPEVAGRKGWYVEPAVALCRDGDAAVKSPLYQEEMFAPVAMTVPFRDEPHAVQMHEATPCGLSASVFTASRETFERIGKNLQAGNLYWNLPTTFSPSALPFGGWKQSGNGRPGGRGFIRFAAREQAVQFGS